MPVAVAADFFRAARPARVHLLGLGPQGPRFPDVRAALLRARPDAQVSCDSVVITAVVGYDRGVPRPLTAALQSVVAELDGRPSTGLYRKRESIKRLCASWR